MEAEHLAQALADAVAALRGKRWDEADGRLAAVEADPDWLAAEDLGDLKARVRTLRATALIELGRFDEAGLAIADAQRASREAEDAEALAEVRALSAELIRRREDLAGRERQQGQQKALLARPLEPWLAEAPGPLERASRLIQRANAEIDHGSAVEGERLARWALTIALAHDGLREEVMGRMSLARARPDQAREQLHAAWRRADDADDFNLVGWVARAAELSEVTLPALDGASGRMR